MVSTITIDTQTCKACGTCADVCPNHTMYKNNSTGVMGVYEDRIKLCEKCGQCMAVCPTASINVEGLSYEKDFAPLPESGPYEDVFYKMIASRRSVRNFKDKSVPRELLEKIADAIRYAPLSFPPHKTEITIVQDRGIIEQALPAMIDMYDMLVKMMDNPVMKMMIKKSAGPDQFRTLENHVIPIMKDKLPELRS
ncbi:MAG: 4Fe-4S dicluster domain-containing protein, partial [Dehalococcoidia bacterium]